MTRPNFKPAAHFAPFRASLAVCHFFAALLSAFAASAVESVTITFGGKNTRCEVLKFLKNKNDEMQMQVKLDFGEQTLPLRVFSKQDVHTCYDALKTKSPALRLDMAQYFYAHEEFDDARIEATGRGGCRTRTETAGRPRAAAKKSKTTPTIAKVAAAAPKAVRTAQAGRKTRAPGKAPPRRATSRCVRSSRLATTAKSP